MTLKNGPMLNAYPDSIGGTLDDIAQLLTQPEFKNVFDAFYILPSLFHYDLDRGFSVIDYEINEELASHDALVAIKAQDIRLKLDLVLNHLSAQSPQFMDILEKGEQSQYRDFFIDWNRFWEGNGTMNEEGYIEPDAELIKDMFFRKPGLPIMMVQLPDGKKVPYWNTFYQNVTVGEDGKCSYAGQLDLNIASDSVWEYYRKTIHDLAKYGASILRLDAFAYAPKAPGKKNFMNDPETWDFLEQIQQIAAVDHLALLPEIHASYSEKVYETVANKGYMTYDFFLPGLIIDALEAESGERLCAWAKEVYDNKIRTVNMLGCHDGIPMLDLKGLLPDERIEELIAILVKRGGHVKELHGKKNMYYQVNATYFSALGEDEKKLLLARALQMFMPGKPQIWYLDLFAGTNDYEAMARAGKDGHKEINRTNLTLAEIQQRLTLPVVQKQLELLRFRNTCSAFGFDSHMDLQTDGSTIAIQWSNGTDTAWLQADLKTCEYQYGTR